MTDSLSPSYHVDGIQFAPDGGPVSIQFAQPEDVGPRVQEFRQLNVLPGASEEIDLLIADIQDSVCELIDLAKTVQRAPAAELRSRRAR